MSKLESVERDGKVVGYLIRSPATGNHICFYTDTWSFNGNLEKPTFSTSMLIHPSPNGHIKREHFFVRDGKIEYLSDCDHSMAGKTVDMVEVWEEDGNE